MANDCCHALRTAVSVHEGPHIPGTENDFGFVCLSFPSGFVCLSFSTAEVDVQPAAVSWQDWGEASFVWATFSRPFPREGEAVHSLNRAAPSSRAAAESTLFPHVRVRRPLGSSRVDASLWLAAPSAILHLPPSPRTHRSTTLGLALT